MATSENQVELKLGLDISGVQKALYDMIGQFTGTGKEFDKVTKKIEDNFKGLEAAIKRYGAGSKEAEAASKRYSNSLTALVVNGINPATQSFQQLDKAMTGAGNAANMASGNIKKSNMAFTNIALVVQDLPYGFRGIQNNLPALFGSMAGGAGAAYLAFSAVVAAITAWDMGLFNVKKKTEDAKKAQDSYNESLKTAMSSGFGEISQVKALISVVENQGLSIDKRRIALKKLQDQYPDYFKNMSAEKTSISQLETATSNLTSAIIARAEANAMSSEIEKLAGERYNNTKTIEKNELAILNMTNSLVILSKQEGKHMSQYGTITRSRSPYDIQLEKIKKIEEENKSLTASNETLGNSIAKLQNSINFRSQTTVGLSAGQPPKATGKSPAQKEAERMAAAEKYLADWQIKLNTDIANAQVKEGDRLAKERENRIKQEQEDYNNNLSYFDQYYNNLFDLATNDKNAQNQILKEKNNNLLVALANGTILYDDYIKRVADNTKALIQINKSIADEVFRSMLQIGNGLMNALAPSFDMLIEKGASLGDVLTNAFKNVIKQLAKVIALALIAVTLMLILFPAKLGTMGGAKVGEVATGAQKLAGAGKLFGSLIGQGMGIGGLVGGGKFANGGIISGPTYGLMGEYPGAKTNPEVVAPLDKLKDLIGGGGSGQFVLRGQDLVLAMSRSEKSLNLRRG